MADHGKDSPRDSVGFTAVGRLLKYLSGVLAVVGLIVAANGALRVGTLAFSLAVALFGVGKLLTDAEDRAVSLVVLAVSVFSVFGVVGHLLTGPNRTVDSIRANSSQEIGFWSRRILRAGLRQDPPPKPFRHWASGPHRRAHRLCRLSRRCARLRARRV